MKKLLLLLLIIASEKLNAQSGNNIVIGTIDSVYSSILKEKRKIWVYVPNSTGNSIFSIQRYPVVYLLDGDAHFYSVMGMIQQLSEVNGNTVLPEMILVGIPNTDRTRDLTPTHVSGGPYMDSAFVRTSGGGERFTDFLEKELIPHIDSLYPTAPNRTLIGHSFGGLMVVNTLIHHPDLFNSYLAIDPSLWWDKQKLLKESETALHSRSFAGKSLFLAIANTMNAGMDTLRIQKDTSGQSIHIRSILEFSKLLKRNNGNGLRWTYRYYNDDNHGSVPLIAEYDGFRFIYNFYQFPFSNRLFDPAFNADSAIALHFKNISRNMSYNVVPPESLMNSLGYFYMQNKSFDKAYNIFKRHIDNYPQSFNAYDSMGDLFAAKDDRQKAIEYYSKALTIKDYPDTKNKLEKMKQSK
ncbi:MAG: alpha/beta hydrolase-fold protein [Flavisolibacter sp.]